MESTGFKGGIEMNLALNKFEHHEFENQENFPDGRYLGPARVLKVAGDNIQVEISEVQVWSRSAIVFPYTPAFGDIVLVLGQDDDLYVIGVLKGTGKTSFTAPGDIEFKAPRGNIEMISAKGIRIRSPKFKVKSNEIEFMARVVVEKYENAKRWIKDMCQLRAGRVQTSVESTYRMKAGKIIECAEGDVKIDGNKIHLG
jgi:hypothetical protein